MVQNWLNKKTRQNSEQINRFGDYKIWISSISFWLILMEVIFYQIEAPKLKSNGSGQIFSAKIKLNWLKIFNQN